MRWHPEKEKSVAGLMGGTVGLTTGTVTALTKENYRPRSDERDRQASSEPLNGPTTGTHIIYQMGSGVEVVREQSGVVVKLQPRGGHHAS
ncbi:hypothetical protein JH26_04910 [Microvirga sp. BSC39]|nr:hypothetical protein JH26_04910 [Microvirga sp. BSC39]